MAIVSGVGRHLAWLNVSGMNIPIEHGTVSQEATKKSSTFSAAFPMSLPGVEAAMADLGDNTATIIVETRGTTATLVTGEIDDVYFDYISREIKIAGRDKAAKLHENMSSEKWVNRKGSDIVSDLAGRVGLSVSPETSTALAGKLLEQDYVKLSDNVSFGHIIHKLAEFDGARWWVDAKGNMFYVSSNNPSGIYTLNYTPPGPGPIISDCLRLTIKRNVQAGKGISVTVKSWHPKDKQSRSYTSNVQGRGGPLNYNYHIPNLKFDHVRQHARSRAKDAARHELRLEATVVGDPTVNAGMGLQLNGTGYWDQLYEIDTVHHEIGMSGHRTSIVARSPKSGRSEE